MAVRQRIGSLVKKLPLRLVLVVPFVFLVCTAVIATGYLSWRTGQQAVAGMAGRLTEDIALRIADNLRHFFTLPLQINQVNRDAVAQGWLAIDDLASWKDHLSHQAAVFKSITNIAAGNQKGEYIGIDTRDSGQVVIQRCDALTGFYLVSTGLAGSPALVETSPGTYDPRTRPWYRAPAAAGQPRWSVVYKHFVDPALQIALSLPLVDGSGALQGVVTAAVRLEKTSQFMETLAVGRTGLAYIVDPEGFLIASSARAPTFSVSAEGKLTRIRADESDMALIRQAAALVKLGTAAEKAGAKGPGPDGGPALLVRCSVFQDPFGLNWNIVVALPEADFMSAIHANVRTTVLLCLQALLLAVGAGLVAARWITGPILLINQASQDLVAGRRVQDLPTDRGDELGQLARAFVQMSQGIRQSINRLQTELDERRQVEAALRQANLVVENSPVVLFRWRAVEGWPVETVSANVIQFGYTPEALLSGAVPFAAMVHPADLDRVGREVADYTAGGVQRFEQEYRIVAKNGDVHWVDDRTLVERNADGQVTYYQGILIDIPERIQARNALQASLAEKEALLNEVHHRVKNNLQVVSSLLNLQFHQIKNARVRSFLQETQNRVRSMAMLHEMLYHSGNVASIGLPAYIKGLCDHLARSYGSAAGKIRLACKIADVDLDIDQAILVGLIVTELVSNALKHAFVDRPGGDIVLELHEARGQGMVLRVSDNGIGLPEQTRPDSAGTLGLLLVNNLAGQLEGHVSVSREQGTVFEIVFPLPTPSKVD